jgi:hypothetical protein
LGFGGAQQLVRSISPCFYSQNRCDKRGATVKFQVFERKTTIITNLVPTLFQAETKDSITMATTPAQLRVVIEQTLSPDAPTRKNGKWNECIALHWKDPKWRRHQTCFLFNFNLFPVQLTN